MKEKGYKGFFGLDFLIEDETGEVYLSENNARLTASSSFYTTLELMEGSFPLLGYHLLSFLSSLVVESIYSPPLISGSEIVVRNNLTAPIKVVESFSPGLYNEKLEFKEKVFSLEKAGTSDLLLEAASEGRIVNPEIELAKINCLETVCGKNGQLNEKYLELVKAVKEKLVLEKC